MSPAQRPFLTPKAVDAARPHLELARDCVDQWIDILLDERQSGHPGGSRSKSPLQIALLFGGAMRYDIRRPERPFSDRYVLGAGHCTPLLYSSLALLSELLLAWERKTGDPRARIHRPEERAVFLRDLLHFRRRGGLPGHAEMGGKTLFVKSNTGPSGHGFPQSVGQAMALRAARAQGVHVYTVEGEGGLTAGACHEARNSAYGLGLSNLFLLVDWNDYGIDDPSISSVVHGSPVDWLQQGGWSVVLCEAGEDPVAVAKALNALVQGDGSDLRPRALVVRTRKGRGYGKYDNKSHGSPHKRRSKEFWATKREFAEKYGIRFEGQDEPEPADVERRRAQALANLEIVRDVILRNDAAFEFFVGRILAAAEAVPERIEGLRVDEAKSPARDPRISDPAAYPADLFITPGTTTSNRSGLARWGAYANAVAHEISGRPLFLACAADLAESTGIAGFSKAWGQFAGFGRYERAANPDGALLPQMITEFTNAALMCGVASVNLSERPEESFEGFLGACATYGSFSYLKYGPMRLFSQTAQDSWARCGQVLWVAGHSGPETAEDSRTHFGIFAPYVTELFPRGHVADLYPFDANETMVLIGSALATGVPILALHCTRPEVKIPDRATLGAPSYFAAARGAYLLRDADTSRPIRGTVILRGAAAVGGAFEILRTLSDELPNVRLVAAPSHFLFERQEASYRESVLPWRDWLDSMVVTSGGKKTAHAWLSSKVAEEFSVSADMDDRWRTGGTVEEVLEEAGLLPHQVLKKIRLFADAREERLRRLRLEG